MATERRVASVEFGLVAVSRRNGLIGFVGRRFVLGVRETGGGGFGLGLGFLFGEGAAATAADEKPDQEGDEEEGEGADDDAGDGAAGEAGGGCLVVVV